LVKSPFGGKLKETVQVFGFFGMEVCGGACGTVTNIGRVDDAGLGWFVWVPAKP
jgi:hypothetical protein